VARAIADPDNVQAEFAVIVRSDLKGQELGRLLMDKLIRYCRARGIEEMVGEALPDNGRMLRMADRLGFAARHDRENGTVSMRMRLR